MCYHKEKRKPFVCSKCGMAFSQHNSLRRHTTLLCGGDEKARMELIEKRKQFNLIYKEKEKPYKCSICFKEFVSEKWLQIHKCQPSQPCPSKTKKSVPDTNKNGSKSKGKDKIHVKVTRKSIVKSSRDVKRKNNVKDKSIANKKSNVKSKTKTVLKSSRVKSSVKSKNVVKSRVKSKS